MGHLVIDDNHRISLKTMPGYNTDIEHKDMIFHVQTQDQGTSAQYVESIVYTSGKVLASRRTYYTKFLNSPTLHDKISEIIDEQHDGILKDISEGTFDHL
jgi:hypothetical protein